MNLAAVINDIANRVPTDDNVYIGEDGLQYCKKCLTARQCRVDILGSVRVVNCICKCMVEQREREEEQRKQRELMEKIKRYRSMGFADSDMQQFTFAVDDQARPALTKAMRAYVEHFRDFRKEGKGLFLYGPVGTGKTFLAACVCNALIDEGYPCLMTNFSRLTNMINGSKWDEKQTAIDELSKFALIAIDDLGVERDTEFMNESVTTIIDTLYRAKVPMIITSNYSPRQLTGEGDIRRVRVYDRLLERCHPIVVEGESRRKQKGREEYSSMRDLLGI